MDAATDEKNVRFSSVPVQPLAGATAGDAVTPDEADSTSVGAGVADGSMAGVASSLTDADSVSDAPAAEPAAPVAPDPMGAAVPFDAPHAAASSAMAATSGRRRPGIQKDR